MKKPVIILLFLVPALINSQYKNIKINSLENRPNEVTIAINPNHPNNIIAGANLNNYYYTFDGGASWVNKTLTSKEYGVWGDPAVIFDAGGGAYFFHLSRPSAGEWIDRIVCQRSSDGGMTWDDPGTFTGLNLPKKQDKHWICADITNSKWKNNIYVTWTQFDGYNSRKPEDSSNIMFSLSSDGGSNWTAAKRINEFGGDCRDSSNSTEGAVPCVGPNGEIYVGWSNQNMLYFNRSTDGGQSWLVKDIIAGSQYGGWAYDIPDIFRCNGLPVTACDISSGPFRGNLYINYSDRKNGEDDVDVFIVKSTDGGNSWSEAIRVNDDPSGNKKHQFMSWMHVDPMTGAISIIYYDRRNYNDSRTDVYLARSTSGGESFSNIRISEEPFIPAKGIFFGDYIGVNTLNDFTACVWQRLEGSKLSIIYCGIDFKKQ
ncbi:MAG: sialidase family protein [Ignavibacteria bacterium]